jgi:hypothetical protein
MKKLLATTLAALAFSGAIGMAQTPSYRLPCPPSFRVCHGPA